MSFRYRAGEELCTRRRRRRRRRRTMTAVTAKSIGNGLVNVGHYRSSDSRQATLDHRRAYAPTGPRAAAVVIEPLIAGASDYKIVSRTMTAAAEYYNIITIIISLIGRITLRARVLCIKIIIARSCPLSPNILIILYCR